MKHINLMILALFVVTIISVSLTALFESGEKVTCAAPCLSEDVNVYDNNTQKRLQKGETKADTAIPQNIAKPHDQTEDTKSDHYVVSGVKKAFDENWCVASDELNETDFNYALTLEQEWLQYIGRASAKTTGKAIYHDDTFYPDNAFVASYQELPIEELEGLAFDGDKWAMIAFVQRASFLERDKATEISNRLLVSGASYHAVEYLILNELASASSSYKLTNKFDKAAEHMVNAVAYTMIGIKDYHPSALSSYISNVSDKELFEGVIDPSFLLEGKQDKVREKYLELVESIEQERERQLIDIQSPPEAVKRLFEQRLANYRFRHGDIINSLQSLKVTPEVDFNPTPCTKTYMARLTKLQEQEPTL